MIVQTNIPNHIAIIMDLNLLWANQRRIAEVAGQEVAVY
jgi:undecaprenyl pyrophosphate synthase